MSLGYDQSELLKKGRGSGTLASLAVICNFFCVLYSLGFGSDLQAALQ